MKIMITGTDKRSEIVGEILKNKIENAVIYEYCGKIDEDTDVIILPTPVTKDGITLNFTNAPDKNISALLNNAPEKAKIIGAGFTNHRVIDLCLRDDFSIKNAVPTAEGAIAIAMENTDTTLFSSNILVTGFGRVSKILLNRLLSFKASLTVAVRKSGNIAEIKALGMNAIHTDSIKENINKFDIVFNTVPYLLFDRPVLENAENNTLFIELASRQAGFDINYINHNKLRYINAPGLPGKVAPLSAGEIMAETILKTLKENNMY